MKLQFKWSTVCIVATVSVLGLIAFTAPLISFCRGWEIGIWAAILFLLLFFIGLCPLYLKADDKKLIVKRIVGKVSIPYDRIQAIEVLEHFNLWQALRIGSGGFFGYTGIWYHGKIGWFTLYATENKRFLFVKTGNKQYVIGCREPEEFVSYIEEKKKKNYAR